MPQLRHCQGVVTLLPSARVTVCVRVADICFLRSFALREPALGRDDRRRAGRLFGRPLLANPELLELAPVGQETVQQTDDAGRQEEPADDGQNILAGVQTKENAEHGYRQADHSQPTAPDGSGRCHGQVVRGVGHVVALFLLDALELAPRNQEEHLGVPERFHHAGLRAHLVGTFLRTLVQRRQSRGGQVVAHFVDRDADMPRQVEYGQRDERLPADEHELQNISSIVGFERNAEHGRNEGRVKGHQLVVRNHPASFEQSAYGARSWLRCANRAAVGTRIGPVFRPSMPASSIPSYHLCHFNVSFHSCVYRSVNVRHDNIREP